MTPDSLRLSWTVAQGTFDSFVIQYKDAQGQPQAVPVKGDENTVTIPGLESDRKYKMNLYGFHGRRRVGPVSTVVTTGESGPQGPFPVSPQPSEWGLGSCAPPRTFFFSAPVLPKPPPSFSPRPRTSLPAVSPAFVPALLLHLQAQPRSGSPSTRNHPSTPAVLPPSCPRPACTVLGHHVLSPRFVLGFAFHDLASVTVISELQSPVFPWPCPA